jgi:hypothetical protein
MTAPRLGPGLWTARAMRGSTRPQPLPSSYTTTGDTNTAKLNGVNPHAWLADTLTKLVNRWPASRIDELMPWAYAKTPA